MQEKDFPGWCRTHPIDTTDLYPVAPRVLGRSLFPASGEAPLWSSAPELRTRSGHTHIYVNQSGRAIACRSNKQGSGCCRKNLQKWFLHITGSTATLSLVFPANQLWRNNVPALQSIARKSPREQIQHHLYAS